MQIILPLHTKGHIDQLPLIYQFEGEHRYLSNFWPCKVILPAEDDLPAMEFDTIENAYVAWKTKDLSMRKLVQTLSPGTAKRLSYTDNFEYRKPYTDEARIDIMRMLVEQKFSLEHPELLKPFLDTDDALIIEGNLHCDAFFGFNLEEGFGHNYLGRIHMDTRRLRKNELNYKG